MPQHSEPFVISRVVPYFAIATLIGACLLLAHPAYAHFYGGQTENFGEYSIVFVTSTDPPIAGDNSTKLDFSVLQLGDNIYNIQSSVIVKAQDSGNTILEVPYKTYEFSDISLPGVFPKPGNYNVTLATKIVGDSKYGHTPLVASFIISAMDAKTFVPLYEKVLLYSVPPIAAAGGAVVFLRSKGKLRRHTRH